MSTIVRVQRKGQVTIPTRLRVQVGLLDGDQVEAKADSITSPGGGAGIGSKVRKNRIRDL